MEEEFQQQQIRLKQYKQNKIELKERLKSAEN